MTLRLPRASAIPTAAWQLFATLVFIQVTVPALTPILAELQREFSLSYQQTALFVSAIGVMRLVFDLPIGWIISTFNRRTLLLLMSLATLSGCAWSALAPGFESLLAARAFLGVTTALATMTIIVWLGDIAPSEVRGTVLGLNEAMFAAATVVGSLSSGVIATLIHWRWSFVFAGACAMLAGAIALRLPTVGAIPDRSSGRMGNGSYLATVHSGGVAFAGTMVLAFAIFFNRSGFGQTFVPLFAGVDLHLDPAHIGFAQTVGAVLSFTSVALGGLLGDRYGRSNVGLLSMVALTTVVVIFPLAYDFPTFLIASMLMGMSNFANGMPPALIPDILPVSLRGRGIGIYRWVSDVAILAAPFAVGVILDHWGREPTIVFSALQLVVSAVLMFFLFRVRTSKASAPSLSAKFQVPSRNSEVGRSDVEA